ncbi:MAG: hypothetical protein U0P45_12685 [Acidimicrobiales bacterium]
MTEHVDSDSGGREGFTTQELIILELVAAGESHEVAGAAVGRSAKTVQRLLRRPEAMALVRTIQAERLDQVVAALGLATVKAAKVICEELEADQSEVRLRAADLAMRHYDKVAASVRQRVVIDGLRMRIDELRAQLEAALGEESDDEA